MRSARAMACCLALLLALPTAASGPYQPPRSEGCVECTIDDEQIVACEPAADPADAHWSGCLGGWYCYTMPGGGTECHPDCGNRCIYV